uniref:Uncharacterized protein n=1 Tax=Phlebotomus papatasi TaxID=29031 RepID=A0A1B0GQC6_PHLPP
METEQAQAIPNSFHNSQVLSRTTINEDDVELEIKKLKNRKSPGLDGITNEHLKYGGYKLTTELTRGEIPTDWKTCITIPIFKKGSKTEPKNYRGITLLSMVQKLLTKLMGRIIVQQIPMPEEQNGFRHNRSTTDAIFIVRQLVEKSIEFDKPLFMCFVDLTQAFDRVRLEDVLTILQEHNLNVDIINVVKDLNINNQTRIRINGQLSREIPMVRMGSDQYNIVCYADDAVLMAENEDDLQRLFQKFNISALKYNMSISTSKTKALTVSKEPIRCKLYLNNAPIEQVMEFKYLGVETTS